MTRFAGPGTITNADIMPGLFAPQIPGVPYKPGWDAEGNFYNMPDMRHIRAAQSAQNYQRNALLGAINFELGRTSWQSPRQRARNFVSGRKWG